MPKSTVVQDVVLPELDYSGSTTRMLAENDVIPIRPKDIRGYAINQRETLRLRERQLLSALTQLAELRAASEWVSVEDRLPPEDWVLLRYASGAYTVGGYVDGDYVSQMGSLKEMNARTPQFTPATITHWRPLPPQPSPASAAKGE